jgi:hypothetical protein
VRRPVRLLAIGALVAALLLAWWVRRDRDDAPAPDAARQRAPTAAPLMMPAPPAPRGQAVAPVAAGTLPLDRAPSPYPPNSQPLTEGTDPAMSAAEDVPVDAATGVHAVIAVRRDVVHPPDPIVVDLAVLDRAGKRLAIRDARAYLRDERATAATGTGVRAPFVDDGSGADRAAGDLAYTATIAPSPQEQHTLARFRAFVEVAFDVPNLGARRYTTWVTYTPRPHAALDRTFAERVEGGSLIVDVGLAVAERGRYKVIASLYAADRATAIAFAQDARPLDAGRRSIPLVFFGKILHDRGVDGPYVLRYAMVFEEFPERGSYWPGDTVDDAFTTAAYRASDFSPASYVAPPLADPQVTADSPSQLDKPPPLFTR